MKKIFLLLIASSALLSCGDEKPKKVPVNEEKKISDKYALEIDAIYEKDDSLVAFYQMDDYFQYEKPISLKIKGSPDIQRLNINFPEGIAVENIKLEISTNKTQDHITVKNISIRNGKEFIDGDNYKHAEYFLTDESLSWDEKNSRYILNHSNKYPPGFLGNENLQSMLAK
jgi:hypothetical protein